MYVYTELDDIIKLKVQQTSGLLHFVQLTYLQNYYIFHINIPLSLSPFFKQAQVLYLHTVLFPKQVESVLIVLSVKYFTHENYCITFNLPTFE